MAGSAALAVVLLVAGSRLNDVGYSVVLGLGTVLISLAAVSNGERSGGPAGYDELYYLWVVFYAAYYLRRRTLALQVLLIAVAYAVTLVLIDPGPIATSRWLTVIGLVTGGAVVVRLLSEHVEQLLAELDEAASTDRLTGLANRRALEEPLPARSRAGGTHGRADRARPARPQSLQAHQRPLRARGRRHGAGRGRRAHAQHPARDRRRRPGRGRRVRPPAPQQRRRERDRRRRAAGRVGRDRYAGITPVGFCFGVAACEAGAESLDDLMRRADQELYVKKRARYSGASSTTPLSAPLGRR